MSAAENMVVDERRVSDRRAQRHLESAPEPRGKTFNSHERAHTEVLLCETQAAADSALEALSHAIAASQTLLNELRAARAASVASRRAAHLAAGQISGVTS